MKLGERGTHLIQSFEELRLKAYRKFPHEPWTAGWGHTGPDVTEDTECTPVQAAVWFWQDTKRAVDTVNRCVNRPLTQNQFDALVSFAYNVGDGALQGSTLLRLLNDRRAGAAAAEFEKWDHVNGKVVEGLDKRREAERDLFLEAV
jgi:lysozyme